jgi:hypothetical protein
MKNAHLRFGSLSYVKSTEKATTSIKLRLDRFIGEVLPDPPRQAKAHLISVIGGADAVWKALNTEHQKLFLGASRLVDDSCSIEVPTSLLTAQADPAALVEEAIAGDAALIFGQRPGSLSGRRARGRQTVARQASLFE